TVSYKINDKIGVGAGFVYGIGSINLQKDLPVTDANGNFGSAQLKGNANGVGFNAGIYLKPIEKLSIGITYRSQVNMKVNNGTATFNVPSSTGITNGSFTSSLPLPQVVSLGIGFSPIEKLLIAADISFIGWSSYKTLEFDYSNTNTPNTVSQRNYKNTFSYRLGAQYKVTNELKVRVGSAYEATPVQSGYVTPEVPDANRINLTAGIGYTFAEKLTVDASFTFVNFQKRTDTNIESNFSGTYKTYIAIPGLSLSYNF
ncbi:MAG TPA: outer membrane protein transport protein, partial [Cytophagaceae bacterium]|nr:outer membrane protein transport protein [Cytophagaceae bacterium]